MGIGVFAFEVVAAGIYVTIVVVLEVIVSADIFHGVSPRSWFGCHVHSFLSFKLAMD